jgi:ubiquinone/menaquinone biosynthesis C-methylase UbiE
MSKGQHNETLVEEAFTRQSSQFDRLYGQDEIIRYKRERVRQHIESFLQPGSNMLELNAGTGEDTIYFAGKGHRVHATDISSGMMEILQNKARGMQLGNITAEICSFNRLENLALKGPYDHIYSNFGGLNCTGELEKVLFSLDPLLKPGGMLTLVIISRFCLWETALLLKGKFRTATRRWFSKKGRKAHMEDRYFKCWYYSPSYVIRHLPGFQVKRVEGLCTFVPPSYMEGFNNKYPRIYFQLKKMEDLLAKSWPWRSAGDYFIISLKKPV